VNETSPFVARDTCFARHAAKIRFAGYYGLLLFVIFHPFSDACQTNYLKVYLTDLCQIFRSVELLLQMVIQVIG